MTKEGGVQKAKDPPQKKAESTSDSNTPNVTLSAPPQDEENAPSEDRTVSTEDFDNEDGYDDEMEDDQDMPLLNYSRLFSAGLSRRPSAHGSSENGNNQSPSYFDPSCTCSELTVIRVDPEDLSPSGGSTTNATFATATTSTNSSRSSSPTHSPFHQPANHPSSTSLRQQQQLLTSDLWQQPHLIMACGWEARNTITLTNVVPASDSSSLPVVIVGTTSTNTADATSATGPVATIQLAVRDGESTHSVIDMSFDSSGTVLGAIDEGGTCAIWEMKYTATLQPNRLLLQSPFYAASASRRGSASSTATTTATTATTTRPDGNNNMFSNWMSALTGMPPSSSSQSHDEGTAPTAAADAATSRSATAPAAPTTLSLDGARATLTAQLVSQPSRINYPASWGPPTCMVLEPSFKRKREKSLLVGFANGRLVLTKRGTFFQRRNDTVLYQAGNNAKDTASQQYRGIETVAWRGSLVAWADSNGIKLLDMEHMTRIAHIDRPAGARPSLYPTVRDLSPTLYFETSRHLLVAWGDCLMQMQIDEHVEPEGRRPSGSSTEGNPAPSEVKKRRTVQCTMAWELDCVACDAVPMDANHIAVLGLVPLMEEEGGGHVNDTAIDSKNDVALQILSRIDGSVSHCDALPLLKNPAFLGPDSVLPFRLLSTFALPRMEDSEESKVLQSRVGNGNELGFVGIDVEFDLNQNLFSGTDAGSRRRIEYRDPHLQWKLDSIANNGTNVVPEESDNDPLEGDDNDDSVSVDSDDYECILRPIDTFQAWNGLNLEQKVPAPMMVICSASDAVLSLVSTIDDAIANALTRNKCAQALKLGLRHRRQLRQYSLDELADRYMEAVLRVSHSTTNELEAEKLPLSLRRVQLAVKAMPILFGNTIPLWEKWTKELENLPGALFLARNYLPVRDPILPASLYERALEKMLMDAENLAQMAKENVTVASNVEVEGTKQFLESLVAWGPTKILKEYIKLYKYSRDQRRGDKAIIEDLKGVEVALQRRYMQTAAVYLQLPARDSAFGYEGSSPRYDNGKDETQDSLFGVSKVLAIIAPRVPLALSPDDTSNSDSPTVTPLPHILPPNNQTSLEAMARLRMMEGRTDLALKCLLAIGACHSTESLESFETKATDIVNGGHSMEDEPPVRIGTFCYDYIMVLIESQHLNQCLLQDDFVLSTDSKLFKPLIALLRLVGLQRLGNFLIEHCVSPDFSYNMTLSEASPGAKHNYHQSHEVLRREPLPLDQVAKQLESSPALLHWYLHLVFTRRPEFYIKFPNNAVPPKAVTALHRQHFQLYIDFAGELRDSTKALASTQQYNAESLSTPLLSFLKASLPLGGILPVDARRGLEIERTKNAENEQDDDELELSDSMKTASPHFALELAYIIENFSDSTEKTALGVLNLYLLGCKSLVLAVLFAQRQKQYSSLLWDRLISYCTGKTSDGILFGELLESAAYSGADLARLVERIPPGMVVEGLRPRLVAAVADYRMKLEIYTAATAAGSEEAIVLMREITHRSRRGVRYSFGENQVKSYAELILEKNNEDQGVIGEKITEELPTALSKECKIKPRQVHNRLAYSISRR